MVPDKLRKEWGGLIDGSLTPKLTSFSLQMKLNSIKLEYRLKKVNLNDAVSDLHSTCSKNEKLYENDLKQIFKF